jgi:hypothetical protein
MAYNKYRQLLEASRARIAKTTKRVAEHRRLAELEKEKQQPKPEEEPEATK